MPRLTVRAAQLAATALAFALASRASAVFSLPHGLSFFFPPAGISLAAGAAFGPWGVAGVVLGVIVLPWGAADSIPALLLFGLANGLSAAIPAWVLRHPDGGTGVRLRRVFDYGGVINNLASAAVGTFAFVWLGRSPGQLRPAANDFFLWWTSDLAAALVLGLPLLLALRPEVLLTDPDREMLREWLRGVRKPRWCAVLVALTALAILVVDRLSLGFPHWLAIPLVIPIGMAALEGGAGPAILVSSFACTAYMAVLLSGTRGEPATVVQVLAPAYTTVGILMLFALTGGWLAGRHRRLLDRVRANEAQLERDFERTVASLAAAIDAKDPTTEGHVQRVAHLSVLVGRRLGYNERRLRLLRYGAMLHDVGKIGVPEAILNKPGGLTAEEKEVMEQHVEIGLKIIRDVEVLREVDPLIRYHQERWDGTRDGVKYPGYFGLRGEEIPEGARILAVVDAFDAITHDRPYRAGNTVEAALEELRREAGRQFDPRLVDVLAEVLRDGEWLLAEPFRSTRQALQAIAG
ncbi:MAG TPA: HD domain-containing phosphohydrolase [Thermoanaerobaculia bacterium]|jgi:putative nucleotidyltransferase with HDIG domain|nr:HD domain-containing phosphohydrolase [Thermoanaerobaculia bacterium]